MRARRNDSLPDEDGRLGAERIGAYLARERQLRGVTLEELARQTRIPLRSLQRLEDGVFDRDPDGFARGFVRTVALALGLPADETIARMLPETDPADGRDTPRTLRRIFAGLALAVAIGAAAGSVWMWLASSAGEALAPVFRSRADGLVVRRDAVRALAEEHGLLADANAGTFVPGADPDSAARSDVGEPAAPAAATDDAPAGR
jgi:transcriptional regulator with XRE-family HTH domain